MDISVDLDAGGHLVVRGLDDDGTVTNADVELMDTEGRRWSATVMTQPEIGRLRETWRSSGECQSGAFFRVPDLIVVRDPSSEAIIQVFAELHRAGEYGDAMVLLEED